jgi:hypothetical protein
MSIQIGSKSELEKGMAWCYYRHDCQCPIEKYSECIKGTQEPKACEIMLKEQTKGKV